jgi:hypothetical protein
MYNGGLGATLRGRRPREIGIVGELPDPPNISVLASSLVSGGVHVADAPTRPPKQRGEREASSMATAREPPNALRSNFLLEMLCSPGAISPGCCLPLADLVRTRVIAHGARAWLLRFSPSFLASL